MEVFGYILGFILVLGSLLALFLTYKADEKVRKIRDLFYSEAYEYFKRENELNRKG